MMEEVGLPIRHTAAATIITIPRRTRGLQLTTIDVMTIVAMTTEGTTIAVVRVITILIIEGMMTMAAADTVEATATIASNRLDLQLQR